METFSQFLHQWDTAPAVALAHGASFAQAKEAFMAEKFSDIETFAALLSPHAAPLLEPMAQRAQQLTRHHFGKTVRMFVPLYFTNECVNDCKYCGFSRSNKFHRTTITADEVERQTAILAAHGFRSLLLVAGEHPRYAGQAFVEECIRRGRIHMPSVGLEIAPASVESYAGFVGAGADSLTAFQETYHEPTYREMHTSGPKRIFDFRINTHQRASLGGFRRIGLGALYGLYDWRYEVVCLAAHARWLLKHCWRSALTISFPRMRPAIGGFSPDPRYVPTDRELVQLMCALRIYLPTVGFVVSTREPAHLRDNLVQIAATQVSAGASTEPGGYSDCSTEHWHRDDQNGEQFHVADERSPEEVAAALRRLDLEPVWKDYDIAFHS